MDFVNIAVIDIVYSSTAFGASVARGHNKRFHLVIPKEITAEQQEVAIRSMMQNIKIAYSAPFPLQPSEVKLIEILGRPSNPLKDLTFPADHKFWQYDFELDEFNKDLEEFKKSIPELESRYISDETLFKFWKYLKKA